MKKTAYKLIIFLTVAGLILAKPAITRAQTEDNLFLVIRNILSGLVSSIFPPAPEITVSPGDTVGDLDKNPNPNDFNQKIGKPIISENAEYMDPIVCKGTISHQFSWFDRLVSAFQQFASKSRAETTSGWLKGYTVNSLSAKTENMTEYPYEKDVRTRGDLNSYLGRSNIDQESQKKVFIDCVERGDCGNAENLDYAGVLDKLKPYLMMNPERKWEPSAKTEREWLLCHTLSGYKKSIYGEEGKLSPYHDYYAGFITKGGAFFAKPPGGQVSRPLYGIEIFCTVPDLTCEKQGISAANKAGICSLVIGNNYLSGQIAVGSILAKVFDSDQLKINTPSASCLMNKGKNCGHFYMLPSVGNEEVAGKMTEQVGLQNNYPRADDPNQIVQREGELALPINATYELISDTETPGLVNYLSTGKQLVDLGKGEQYQYQIANCNNPVDVGGNVAVPVGGGINEIRDYTMSLWTPLDKPPGEVLQAFSSYPPYPVYPSPTPEPSVTVTHTETRKIANRKEFPKSLENVRNSALLSCAQFLPYDLVELLQKPLNINGVMIAPKDFPQGNQKLNWLGESKGESDTYIPLAGVAPFLWNPANGLCKDLLTKLYDPEKNPEQQGNNMGTWLKTMADKTDLINLAKNPMQRLASFQNQKSDLSQNPKPD